MIKLGKHNDSLFYRFSTFVHWLGASVYTGRIHYMFNGTVRSRPFLQVLLASAQKSTLTKVWSPG